MEISLGPLKLKSPLLLAPIAGYTDSIYRGIASSCGAGLTVTELVSADGIVRRGEKTLELMRFNDDERPLAIQLFGNSPEVMAEAAVIAEELKPDAIDINMGCPSARICRNGTGGGSALLTNPSLAAEIAEAVVKSVSLPVTAKIRLGWDLNTKNYIEISSRLADAGITALFVHGRTRSQKYSGHADWNAISEIAEQASIPVVGNGDISTYDEAYERLYSSGCAAVMIGRGALGNPWIFSSRKPDMREISEMIIKHLDMMISKHGDRGIVLMRKHFAYYVKGFRNASEVRSRLFRALKKGEILEILSVLNNPA